MTNFEKVSTDILNAASNIKYETKEEKFCQAQILLTLYQMLQNEEVYKEALDCLIDSDYNRKEHSISNKNVLVNRRGQ